MNEVNKLRLINQLKRKAAELKAAKRRLGQLQGADLIKHLAEVKLISKQVTFIYGQLVR